MKEGKTIQTSPEIVISYAGTYDQSAADIAADVALYGGRFHAQLLQAARYYLDIKAANPGATLTLTGHSLGGGLAALVGVFFGVEATTFDQAPFATSAKWLIEPDVATTLLNNLGGLYPVTDQGDPLQGLRDFITARGNANAYIPNADKVKNIAVQGEFLSGVLSNTLGDRIDGGGSTVIANTYEAGVGGGDLHSMALLAAYLQSEQGASGSGQTLSKVTERLPGLLGISFKDGLFKYSTDPSNEKNTNFWEHLVRHQAGVQGAIAPDAMVTRFTADLWKLAQGGLTQNDGNAGNPALAEVSKALMAFAMQKYHTETTHDKELFTAVDGAVRFMRTDVAPTWGQTKGKTYFDAWLAQVANGLSQEDRDTIKAQIPKLVEWFVQAGSGGMNAVAGAQRAFMLGGATNDTMTGGAADDLLVGNSGDDTLYGNAGNDTLLGGSGADTYTFGGAWGKDLIADSDGQGSVRIAGQAIGAGQGVGARGAWAFDLGGGQYAGLAVARDSASASGYRAVITLGADTANTITLRDFDLAKALGSEGWLGIRLDPTVTLALQDAAGANPFADIGFDPASLAGQASTLAEGAGKTFTVFLNQAAHAGDTLTLALDDALGGFFKAILGDLTVDADGAVITLKEGQTQVSFALVQEGDISADMAGSLSVSYQGADQGAASNSWGLNLTDAGASTLTFNGDQRARLIGIETRLDLGPASARYNTYAWSETSWAANGTLVGGVGQAGFADVIDGSGGNDKMLGLGGNDALDGGAGGDLIDGGDGDDLIGGDTGSDSIVGGAGNDHIFSAHGLGVPQRLSPTEQWTPPPGTTALVSAPNWGVYSASPDHYTVYGGGPVSPVDDAPDVVDGGAGGDHITGGLGGDRLMGGIGQDDLWGQGGADILEGGEGDDQLRGDGVKAAGYYETVAEAQHGADFIDGGAGNDIAWGQGQNDQLYGGVGNDELWGDDTETNLAGEYHGDDYLDGEAGADLLVGGGQNDLLYGGDGNDRLRGDDSEGNLGGEFHGDDYLDGEAGDDELTGGGKADVLYGGGGADLLWGDDQNEQQLGGAFHGDDDLDGEAGDDQLVGGGRNDLLYGGADNDNLWGDDTEAHLAGAFHGDDELDGEEGDDLLIGGGRNDVLYGGTGVDLLWGDDQNEQQLGGAFHGNDTLDGEEDDDQLIGGGQDDTLYGGEGIDRLWGDDASNKLGGTFHGNDVLDGGTGDDQLAGDGKNDTLLGGDGNDRLWGDDGDGSLGAAFHGDDALDGGAGDDQLIGGGLADTLLGGAGDDRLYGDAPRTSPGLGVQGADWLDGGDGTDLLYGNGGNDTLLGAAGNDQLWGDDPDAPAERQGADWLDGGDGDDVLAGAGGADTLLGGTGDDQLHGDSADTPLNCQGDDLLDGGAGNDVLNSYAGNDLLVGGEGDDDLAGGDGDDVLNGGAGADVLRAGLGMDTLEGGEGDDLYLFELGSGAKHIQDGAGSNTLVLLGGIELGMIRLGLGSLKISTGMAGDEIHLDGVDYDNLAGTSPIASIQFSDGLTMSIADVIAAVGIDLAATAGDDTINGTSGRDIVDALAGDDVIDVGGGGDVVTLGAGNDRAQAGDGDDRVTGDDGDDTVDGGAGHDSVAGGAGADILNGEAGNDTLEGGDGHDALDGGDGNDLLAGAEGDDSLWGALGDDSLSGGTGADALTGGGGADWLDGGLGADQMAGGAGDDTCLVDDLGDQVTEMEAEGYDTVRSTRSFTLGANIEALVLEDDPAALAATGNALDNALSGNAGDNVLLGMAGNDVLVGGAGNDLLDGGTGADTLAGGGGDDTYAVDDTADVITESEAEGIDSVLASADHVLSAHVENLTLAGPAVAGTGNDQSNAIVGNGQSNILDGRGGDDVLTGGAGHDSLIGGSGADAMAGGIGDDLYEVDDAADSVTELAGEGADTVRSWISYALGDNLEHLTLAGDYSIDGTGNAADNVLIGNSAANRLDGGLGADVMIGGDGDDLYVLDNAGDQVVELDNGGIDTVLVGTSYTAGNHVENIELTGSGNVDATGDGGDNRLTGNAGDNRLDGGGGDDWMSGGAGNDTYHTDSQGDHINESADEGTDTEIRAFETMYLLDDGVENLTLTGTVYRGNGNDLDNVITGNDVDNNLWGMAGNDSLIGGGGADALFGDIGQDTLVGGAGNDYFEVDDEGDVVVEYAGEGDDFVRSSVSWTLGANLERLAVDGVADLSVTGNALGNGLWGNLGNNVLTGGLGNDYLDGDVGDDVYVFNRGDAQDSIDTTDILGASDTLRFGAGIADSDVLAFQYGTNLFLKIKGTSDQVGFIDYFGAPTTIDGLAADHKIDRVEFANGVVWDQAMIQTVVDRATNNHAPTVNSYLPTFQARAGTAFSYTVPANTITDPDAWDSVTYSIRMQNGSAVPAWLQFDPVTRVISGTPGAGDVGTLQFVLWGTDNYNYSAGEYVTMTVGAPNRAPTLANALADQATAPGAGFSYAVPAGAFTDPDGDALIYSATLADGSALPSWLSFNASTRTFSGTPGALGTVSVKVTAKDAGNLSVSDIFDITVSIQNLTLNGTTGNDTLTAGAGNDALNGLAGNDSLSGGAGNDTLDGGTGNDAMAGGAGDDTYVVDSASDVVTENANDGTDLVKAGVTFTLGGNVENLTLTGTTAINGTGNTLNNVLTGNAGANKLTGAAGNDTLDGGTGTDSLVGGAGDDTYVVDGTADVVTENAAEGTDTVRSSVTLTLASNVENLVLTGSTAINGTGNTLNNVLTGNSAANTLSGGTGADSMAGGAGNDTYVVDNTGDVVTEMAAEGTDLVQSSVTCTLAANVENLTLTGTTAINGTGNALNNVLTGNSANNALSGGDGNDTIDGGTGNDTMTGGLGDDTYVVNVATDVVTEAASAGTDLVQSAVTYTLGANVENLTLTGTSAINGTGNTLDNLLTGNSGKNILSGGTGNDTLAGGLGNDTLDGGAGTDLIVFNSALGSTNVDTIQNYSVADDTVQLLRSTFSALPGTGAGALAAAAFWTGTAAHDADDRIIYDSASGKLWYDADGNGATAAVQFAVLVGVVGTLTVADFVVA